MPPLNGLLRRSCIHGLPVYLSRVARVVSPLNVARVYDDDEQSEYERAAATDFFLFFFFFPPIRCRTRAYIPRSFPAV